MVKVDQVDGRTPLHLHMDSIEANIHPSTAKDHPEMSSTTDGFIIRDTICNVLCNIYIVYKAAN